jgi:hypothetical protein
VKGVDQDLFAQESKRVIYTKKKQKKKQQKNKNKKKQATN